MSAEFKKVLVLFNGRKEPSVLWGEKIAAMLKSAGAEVFLCATGEPPQGKMDFDVAVVTGGDGTVLHAARILAGSGIPLVAVNSGNLGFLSGLDAARFQDKMEQFLSVQFIAKERFLLKASVFKAGHGPSEEGFAFNDCVIKSMEPRAVKINVRFGNHFLNSYFGDGLIISTPCGSTAYALAASGPIVYPDLDVFVVAPICPHTLSQRPIVVPAHGPVHAVPLLGHGDFTRNPVLSLDGQVNIRLNPGDEVVISKHEKKIKMLYPPDYDYFRVLNDKFRWGER